MARNQRPSRGAAAGAARLGLGPGGSGSPRFAVRRHDCCFARTVAADHAEPGALLDPETYGVQDFAAAEILLRESAMMAWLAVFPGSGGMAPMVGGGLRAG
jgi:hypothetical protein